MTISNSFRLVRSKPQNLAEITKQTRIQNQIDNDHELEDYRADSPNNQVEDQIETEAEISNEGPAQQLNVNGKHHPTELAKPKNQLVFQDVELASINDVLATFKTWVKFDQDLEDSLILSLAVCLANDVPGDPVWLQIVAPPGSGKTMILMALQHSERVIYKSSLTPASLVSGYKTEPDPSLLPQLNGKCAVFKDGTELLCLHPDAKAQIYGILRGAFDGHVHKPFGNGVSRDYTLHFNMLMGITPAVHADSHASMGERFLRFEMHEDENKVEGKIVQAISNISRESNMEEEMTGVCTRFLLRQINYADIPSIPSKFLDRIVALSQLTAMLRATVEREHWGDRDVKYRPAYESGTRIGKQLAKLAAMVAVVVGAKTVNERVYRLVHRVACDSMIGYHKDVIRALCESSQATLRTNDGGVSREELAQLCKISATPLLRRLQDLLALKIVESFYKLAEPGKKNLPHLKWRVGEHVEKLWKRAAPPTEIRPGD